MKELKGIDERTVVHCPTEELAKQVLKIAHEAGMKWWSGNLYIYNENTCYKLNEGLYADLKYYTNEGYTILPAEDFIRLNSYVISDNGSAWFDLDDPIPVIGKNAGKPIDDILNFTAEDARRLVDQTKKEEERMWMRAILSEIKENFRDGSITTSIDSSVAGIIIERLEEKRFIIEPKGANTYKISW